MTRRRGTRMEFVFPWHWQMTVNLPIILAFAGIITHLLLELWNQPAWYYFGDLPECAFLHFAGNCVKRQCRKRCGTITTGRQKAKTLEWREERSRSTWDRGPKGLIRAREVGRLPGPLHDFPFNPAWTTSPPRVWELALCSRVTRAVNLKGALAVLSVVRRRQICRLTSPPPLGQRATREGFHCIHLISPEALRMHLEAHS